MANQRATETVAQTPTASLIADAAIRVAARRGLEALTVRTVAREAAVAPGTVQHHYPTRAELLNGALDRVVQRQLRRVAATGRHTSGVEALRTGLRVLLPVDEARRDEAIVWIAFTAAAAASPTLGPRHREVVALTRSRIRDVITLARDQGEVPGSVDPHVAAILIAACIDGLLVHAITSDGDTGALEALCDAAITPTLGLGGQAPNPQAPGARSTIDR